MITYEQTPNHRTDKEYWSSKHAAISYENPKDIAMIAAACQSFILYGGSGYEYFLWVSEWAAHPNFDWAIIVCADERAWPSSLRGVPIWHESQTVTRLSRLSDDYERVAISGSTLSTQHAVETILNSVGQPEYCKLHRLKAHPPINLPFSSQQQ